MLELIPLHDWDPAISVGRKSERVFASGRTLQAARSSLEMGDSLRQLCPSPLELDRGISPLLPGGAELPFDHCLLELQEVELHRLAASGLAIRPCGHIRHDQGHLLVLTRKPCE